GMKFDRRGVPLISVHRQRHFVAAGDERLLQEPADQLAVVNDENFIHAPFLGLPFRFSSIHATRSPWRKRHSRPSLNPGSSPFTAFLTIVNGFHCRISATCLTVKRAGGCVLSV